MAYNYASAHDHELRPTDHQVIAVVRNGDVEAFEVLVDRYYGSLIRHLAYRLGDPELGADLAQDVFLDAFRHLDRFDGHRPFAAWLFGIAHKRLLSHWRRQRLRRFISLDWLTARAESGTLPALLRDDDSETCHEREILCQAFATLSPSLREALLLHSLDGFTAPEIADVLGIAHPAAARRISRAKEQFRRSYRDLTKDEKGTIRD